jgi:hypothetical protein
MVNETHYRYLWTMEKADEEMLFNELAVLGNDRTKQEAKVEALAEQSRNAAKDALRRGMKPSRIAKALQYTDGYVRKLRIEAQLPPDPRYADVAPPKRNLGMGAVGIGDTLEEAIANSGPIDTGADLRALVVALSAARRDELINALRQAEPAWFQQIQTTISADAGDFKVELLIHALAEQKLPESAVL